MWRKFPLHTLLHFALAWLAACLLWQQRRLYFGAIGAKQMLSKLTRLLITTGTLASGIPFSLAAQVGLSSGGAQVALMVRAAPNASMPAVRYIGVSSRRSDIREAAVKVRFSSNGSYRLVVRGVAGRSQGRVWVRSARGDYQEVLAGSSVTVARGAHTPGPTEREVSYRMESKAAAQPLSLPVRYELVIVPSI